MKGFERVSRNLGMEAIEHKDMGCVEFKMNGKSLWYDLQIVINAFTSKNISEVATLLAQHCPYQPQDTFPHKRKKRLQKKKIIKKKEEGKMCCG